MDRGGIKKRNRHTILFIADCVSITMKYLKNDIIDVNIQLQRSLRDDIKHRVLRYM
jgi:hypothetical protein